MDRFPAFVGLGASLARAFTGTRLLFHAGAVLATLALALPENGMDARARELLLRTCPLESTEARFAALTLGMAWPVVLAAVLIRQGFSKADRELSGAGFATAQAIVVVAVIVGALKLLTGRPQPEGLANEPSHFHLLELSFGQGRFMWPSGHTAEAVAAASALAAFWPGRAVVRVLAWATAAAVAATMLVGCFHWVSDVVAGALIAYPIGTAVGRRYREWCVAPTA